MTERIDHAAEARKIIRRTSMSWTSDLEHAQVHATLALVEELRTANLIAYVAKWTDDQILDIDAQIRGRMGMS